MRETTQAVSGVIEQLPKLSGIKSAVGNLTLFLKPVLNFLEDLQVYLEKDICADELVKIFIRLLGITAGEIDAALGDAVTMLNNAAAELGKTFDNALDALSETASEIGDAINDGVDAISDTVDDAIE